MRVCLTAAALGAGARCNITHLQQAAGLTGSTLGVKSFRCALMADYLADACSWKQRGTSRNGSIDVGVF